MKEEIIVSPILDSNIQDHIGSSPVWNNAFKKDEITLELYRKYPSWYAYSIKFNGLTPVQLTKLESFSLK